MNCTGSFPSSRRAASPAVDSRTKITSLERTGVFMSASWPLTVIIAASPTDSLSQPDTLYRDTSYQLIRGYYGARLYREDLQAVADSAVYITHDSIMKLYGHPIAWSDNQQISADHIDVYMKDSTVDYAHGVGNCIAIQQQTLKYYNQMAG